MTPDSIIIKNKSPTRALVDMADGNRTRATARGTAIIQTTKNTLSVPNALVAQNLGDTLVAVNQLAPSFDFAFKHYRVYISKQYNITPPPHIVVTTVTAYSGVYFIDTHNYGKVHDAMTVELARFTIPVTLRQAHNSFNHRTSSTLRKL